MIEVEIPRYVDSQPQFLWFELDEVLMITCLISLGIIMGLLRWALVALPFAISGIRRMKRSSMDGVAMHFIYSLGVIPLNKEFNDAFEKRFYL